MALMEVREQRLDAGPERPPGLQPGRKGAPRFSPAVRTGGGVRPALNDDWLGRRKLDHLAPSDPAPHERGRHSTTTSGALRGRLTSLP
jgi:hypothetical protein